MKTIGVLGGIGPQATMAFEARIHTAAQKLLPPKYNEGYPPLVSVYLRHAPVLVKDGLPTDPLTLDPRLLDAARKLGTWADVIVIPSNTPHLFMDEIRAAAGREVLSIIDGTLEEIRRRNQSPIGLLGLGVPKAYTSRFESEGIDPIVAPPENVKGLDAAILRLMEGRESDQDRAAAEQALTAVRSAGAAVTVLGCTEIPLLLGEKSSAPDLIDPAQLLAEAAVRAAV